VIGISDLFFVSDVFTINAWIIYTCISKLLVGETVHAEHVCKYNVIICVIKV